MHIRMPAPGDVLLERPRRQPATGRHLLSWVELRLELGFARVLAHAHFAFDHANARAVFCDILGEMILWLSLGLLALAGVAVTYSSGTVTLFNDSFIIDAYARALKLLTLIGADGVPIQFSLAESKLMPVCRIACASTTLCCTSASTVPSLGATLAI